MTINIHRQGSGPPLVLLHGVGHHWQAWRPVIDRLAGGFDVIACDLPGFGRSDPLPPDVDPTVPAYVDAIARWIGELGLQRPHVAGNSMGGAIALELAARGDVASATALSPGGFWTPAERRWCQMTSLGLVAHLPRPLAQPLIRLAGTKLGRLVLLAQLFGHPTRIPSHEAAATLRDALGAPAFRPALAAFSRYAYDPVDKPVTVPVTVAWGNHDWLLPRRLQAPRAQRMLPEAQHVTLSAGHVPYFDDPGAVAAVIRTTAAAAAATSVCPPVASPCDRPPAAARGERV
jgi:pimeloyl-ACP methyl ester carboxylesterase